ncbi:hypothetical protein scyTo_0008497 [Scyliorhinus torazame]|uniref:Uncharacterized protein n=1 Tax=Scyliorhinus torazame TaxID=75743 RepID=A0A401PAB1_SCYTO|nr:hypothetical protein [Scyliorhinus torazame]
MDWERLPESAKEYERMKGNIEKLTGESSQLAMYQKKMVEHNAVLTRLSQNFNQVQSRLERVAAVKPGSTLLNQ